MNQDKLDALYARATDERTPEEERRTAAVLYLKHAPKNRIATPEELRASITKEMFNSLFGPEIAVYKKNIDELREKADAATKHAEKAESDLRELKEAIRAARIASEKVNRLVSSNESAKADHKRNDAPDIAKQINDMFGDNGPFRYNSGGFKW